MIGSIRKWRERRILKHHPIMEPAWRHALTHCGPAYRLSAAAQVHLRVLATLFLREKTLAPVQGLEFSEDMRTLLAAHACMPILNLGLKWYADWHEVVIYPDLFVPNRQLVDAAGVVHHSRSVMAGESWQRGPVILSWEAVMQAGSPPGHNVAIHEFAHKLDMLNGEANGFPPLHREMDARSWTHAFDAAYWELQRRRQVGEPLPLDPYGLESPGEFFAVASELFFEEPRALMNFSSDLYRQLSLFYRQNPAGI